MLNVRFYLLLAFSAGLLSAPGAWADLLDLGEGETFSGQVVRARDGVVVFRTAAGGQMMAPLDTVAGIDSDKSFVVSLKDDANLFGRLRYSGDAQQLVPLEHDAVSQPLDLAQVDELVVIPSPPERGGADAVERWRSSVGAGVLSRHGNEDYLEGFLRLRFQRNDEAHPLQGEVLVQPAGPDESPSFLRAEAEAGLAPLGRGAATAAMRFDRDQSQALDLRTGLELGLTYPLMERGRAEVNAGAGIGVEHERWRREEDMPWVDARADETNVNLRLGLRYEQAIARRGEVEGRVDLYPELTNLGELRARALGAFAWPLSERLRLRLDLQADYDSDPPLRQLRQWTAGVGASLQWLF